MGWISRIFGGVPREELDGLRLDPQRPCWEISGRTTFQQVFLALDGWLPGDAILYFEDGRPDHEILDFFAKRSVSASEHIAMGTIWPRPRVKHVPATHEILTELAEIMDRHAEPELAIHVHAYREGQVLFEWHDATSDPIYVSDDIPEERICDFAQRLGTTYRLVGEASAE
jgi:hypothetical protein